LEATATSEPQELSALLQSRLSYHIAHIHQNPRLSSIIHGGDRIHEMLYLTTLTSSPRFTDDQTTFLKLKEFCEEHTALRNGRLPGKGVSIEEKLAMFLYNV